MLNSVYYAFVEKNRKILPHYWTTRYRIATHYLLLHRQLRRSALSNTHEQLHREFIQLNKWLREKDSMKTSNTILKYDMQVKTQ